MELLNEFQHVNKYKTLGDNLIVLYAEFQPIIILKKNTSERLYPDMVFEDIIDKQYTVEKDNYSGDYVTLYKYLNADNVALIGRQVPPNSSGNVTKNDTIDCTKKRVLYTPIRLDNGSLLYNDVWYEYWDYNISSQKIIFVRSGDHDNYYLILNKKDGLLLNGVPRIKNYYPFPKGQNRIYKLQRSDDKYMLFDIYTGEFLVNRMIFEEIEFFLNNFVFTFKNGKKRIASISISNGIPTVKFETKYLFECQYIDDYFLVAPDENLHLTILNSQSYKYMCEDKKFECWKSFDDKFYLVTLDGMSTLIRKKEFSYLFENSWYKKWWHFDEEYFLVSKDDRLKTLINKNNGKIAYENTWFLNWNTFDKYYYIVRVPSLDNFTLFDRKTGKLKIDKLKFKRIKEINLSKKYYLINGKEAGKYFEKLVRRDDLTVVFDSDKENDFIPLDDNKILVIYRGEDKAYIYALS